MTRHYFDKQQSLSKYWHQYTGTKEKKKSTTSAIESADGREKFECTSIYQYHLNRNWSWWWPIACLYVCVRTWVCVRMSAWKNLLFVRITISLTSFENWKTIPFVCVPHNKPAHLRSCVIFVRFLSLSIALSLNLLFKFCKLENCIQRKQRKNITIIPFCFFFLDFWFGKVFISWFRLQLDTLVYHWITFI